MGRLTKYRKTATWICLIVLVPSAALVWWWKRGGGYSVETTTAQGYQQVRWSEGDRQRFLSEVAPKWKATLDADVPTLLESKVLTDVDIPRRTFITDALRDHAGPERHFSATWADRVRQLETHVQAGVSHPAWWSIVSERVQDETADGIAVGLTPNAVGVHFLDSIRFERLDENGDRVVKPPPALSPTGVDTAVRAVRRPMPPLSTATFFQLEGAIEASESAALCKFLLLCHDNLRPGDTLQLLACCIGDPHEFRGEVHDPPPIVVRLADFLPGVRIVVYEGKVKWVGSEGKVDAIRRKVYVGSP